MACPHLGLKNESQPWCHIALAEQPDWPLSEYKVHAGLCSICEPSERRQGGCASSLVHLLSKKCTRWDEDATLVGSQKAQGHSSSCHQIRNASICETQMPKQNTEQHPLLKPIVTNSIMTKLSLSWTDGRQTLNLKPSLNLKRYLRLHCSSLNLHAQNLGRNHCLNL